RDIVSFLKYEKAKDVNPCAGDVEYAYAFGSSQSGRLLRELIYLGLNEDEQRRVALDGIIAHVAGGLRGEFNIRFGQPSQDICYINPQLFPSSDFAQTDPVTGKRDGLLEKMKNTGQVIPKIMLTNTSAEYWRGDAALIHTDLESETDAPESEWVRRYHFAGAQHGPGNFPPLEVRPLDGIRGQLPFNILDYTPLLRAALSNLDRWVTTGEAAPPSRHPSLSSGSAVESYTLAGKFSKLPGVQFPPKPLQAIRLDHGPETHLGRLSTLPAIQGEVYQALVSDVDDSYNDLAGIRLPHLSVPVATYAGWNLRHPDMGNPNLYIGISGGLAGWTLGLPATRPARDATCDPRLSIEERYASKEDYLAQVREASRFLIEEGYLLSEDIERVEEQAGKYYDYFRAGAKG
ncbi:MAG: alpha/beta hydrolase domain-containing protein, partial [Dehalococcoidia bacterium]|nr:alpha/beta hydrolase domain-containing protein [Dehalococcoidia bacterium]